MMTYSTNNKIKLVLCWSLLMKYGFINLYKSCFYLDLLNTVWSYFFLVIIKMKLLKVIMFVISLVDMLVVTDGLPQGPSLKPWTKRFRSFPDCSIFSIWFSTFTNLECSLSHELLAFFIPYGRDSDHPTDQWCRDSVN